jgi:hypothetical protein
MQEDNQDLETQVEEVEETQTTEQPEVVDDESLDTRDIVEREVKKLEEEKPETEQEEVKPEVVEAVRKEFSSWKKEAQEELAKLPDNVRSMISERESQFHKGLEQYKGEAQFARAINKAIAPHAEYMQSLGIKPDLAFATLIDTERKLRTGDPQTKVSLFQQLAHDYGIDLEQIAQLPFDAQAHQLKQQNEWLQSRLQESQGFQQSQEDQQIQQNIDEFAQTHEFFEDVQATMADLLDRGFAEDLDDAYVKAIRLNDNVFASYQAKQQDAHRQQNNLKANQAAKAAKAAAVSVRGAPTGVTRGVTPATTEDAVREAMKQHGLL